MYSNKDIRDSIHQDIKAQNQVKMRHPVTRSDVKRPPRLPKGMVDGSNEQSFEVQRVSDGDRSQNIRQVYHF